VAKADLFDVVLTDVQMPKMDGITVIKHTRDLEHTHGGHPIPMIAVTAHAFDTERNRIFAAGANGILTKPLDPKDLERQLEDIERRSVPTVTDGSATTVSAVSPGAQVAGVAAPDAESPFVAAVEHILLAQRAEERGPGIDIRDVFSRSGESPRRTLLMMRSFVSCYADILAGLKYVEGSSTAEELGKSAHALKGLLAEAGVKETRALAYDVEKLGEEGKLAEIIPLLPDLVTSTEQVAAVVATIVGSFDKNGVLLAAQEGGASAPA
jgi:CheY-like chemotaxis protein